MERIGGELGNELRRLGPPAAASAVARAWPAAVGAAIAQNSWPARIARDGTLHVATRSAAWAFELTQLETTVRTRLREALGPDAPKRIRFAPGPIPEAPAEEPAERGREAPSPVADDRERASEIAAAISDEELRELVARAAAASLAAARSGRRL
jgi:hypothetical protein